LRFRLSNTEDGLAEIAGSGKSDLQKIAARADFFRSICASTARQRSLTKTLKAGPSIQNFGPVHGLDGSLREISVSPGQAGKAPTGKAESPLRLLSLVVVRPAWLFWRKLPKIAQGLLGLCKALAESGPMRGQMGRCRLALPTPLPFLCCGQIRRAATASSRLSPGRTPSAIPERLMSDLPPSVQIFSDFGVLLRPCALRQPSRKPGRWD